MKSTSGMSDLKLNCEFLF